VVSVTGTELLIKTPEKPAKSEEIGTEFLLGDEDRETSAAESSATGSTVALSSSVGMTTTRRRRSRDLDAQGDQLDESGPGREMKDITADAMSIQPTGYTLETAHVRFTA